MGRHVQASARLGIARAVIAAWVVPSLAFAGPGPRANVRVEIDVSQIEEFDAGGIEREVRGRTELLLDQHGYFLDDAATDSIVVHIDYVNKENLEYGIHIDVLDDGKAVPTDGERVVCQYCNHSMVADRYAELLPAALERLAKANAAAEEPAVEEPVEDDGTTETEDGGGSETEPADDSGANEDEPKPQGSLVLRNAGLGLLVPGGVALGVGLGLVAVGTREVDQGNEAEIAERNYRTPGTVIAIAGGVATVAGIGLLVAHAMRGRRQGGDTSDRVSWGPVIDGTHAGVILRGRF